MTAYRPVVLMCDAPGCETPAYQATEDTITEARKTARSLGWSMAHPGQTTTGRWEDRCPEHHPAAMVRALATVEQLQERNT